jgi:hypothetical protein
MYLQYVIYCTLVYSCVYLQYVVYICVHPQNLAYTSAYLQYVCSLHLCLSAVCGLHLCLPAICGLLLCLHAVHVVYTYACLQTDTLRSKGGLSGLDYCGLQDGAYPHCLTKAGGPVHLILGPVQSIETPSTS